MGKNHQVNRYSVNFLPYGENRSTVYDTMLQSSVNILRFPIFRVIS